MSTSNVLWIVLAVIALMAVVSMAAAWWRIQRSNRLQERFGPEYDRALEDKGGRREAEKELEERIAHVKKLDIRPLTAEDVDRYGLEWQATQREFVDAPLSALQKADRLIREVMKAKGYPVEDFEQRVADISVHYPELVEDYRGMHLIAIKEIKENVGTEEIRQAMVHGRALFEHLIRQDSNEKMIDQKEKI
jgi:hypothetical protein